MDDIRRHAELVDREANVFNIADAQRWREEARAWRDASMSDLLKNEERDAFINLQASLNWLMPTQSEQSSILDPLEVSNAGTADWILDLSAMKTWLKNTNSNTWLWLTGKPGLGNVTSGSCVLY